MPRPRRAEYDSEEFAARYRAGETLESLADWLNVSVTAVFKAAQKRRLQRARMEKVERRATRKLGNNPPDLVRAYIDIHHVLSRGQ